MVIPVISVVAWLPLADNATQRIIYFNTFRRTTVLFTIKKMFESADNKNIVFVLTNSVTIFRHRNSAFIICMAGPSFSVRYPGGSTR